MLSAPGKASLLVCARAICAPIWKTFSWLVAHTQIVDLGTTEGVTIEQALNPIYGASFRLGGTCCGESVATCALPLRRKTDGPNGITSWHHVVQSRHGIGTVICGQR